uniref:DNA-directed RNA polymerase I subunit RPA49 n=1 Tax=Cuerna arida TaxID=1464854 RepID=A0A1B6GTW9_9HEMI
MDTVNSLGENSCKIKKVVSASKLINPLLINVDNRTLTDEEINNCKCSWFEDEEDRSIRVVSLSNKKNTYEGTTEIKRNLCKTVLVLQNKKTKKVQLIEVGECRLGRVTKKRSLQTNYDNDDIEATYEENRSLLLKAFGSKRSKRISDMGSKMRINSEMMTSQIEHSAADVTVNLRELELADSTLDTCLPLCHRNVTSITDVYPLHDFLTQPQLDSLEDEAFTVATLMPFTAEESGYSQFFIDAIERLQNKVNTERIKILLFVEALLRFINLPLKKLRKSDLGWRISPFSTEIAKKILEEFMIDSAGGRTRNVVMDDKIVIHLIILVTISCDFVCNLDELSKYLPKFSVVKMGQMARALCLSSRDKITWFLKLPLPPARSFYMRKRK